MAEASPRPFSPPELPAHLRKDLSQINADLYSAISVWLRKHGKGVKPKLTDEQRQQLKECFELMDQDGSGAIDAEELGAAFKLLGIRMKRADLIALLSEVDHDGSGEVEYPEFLEIMTVTLQRLAEEEGTEKNEGQVPFALMATAYRRKRLMEGIINGDKEVQAQIQQISDKANLEMLQQTKAAELEALRTKAAGEAGPGPGSSILRLGGCGRLSGSPRGRSPSGRPTGRFGGQMEPGKQLMDNLTPDERRIINSLAGRAAGTARAPPPPTALMGSNRPYGSFCQSPTHRQLLDSPQLLDLRFVHSSTIKLPPGASAFTRGGMGGSPSRSMGGGGSAPGGTTSAAGRPRSSSASRGLAPTLGYGSGPQPYVTGSLNSPRERQGGQEGQLPTLRYEGGGAAFGAAKKPLGKVLGTHLGPS